MVTLGQLRQVMPHAGARAETYIELLNSAMDRFSIDSPQRQAAFLAEVAHESSELRYALEIASGESYEGRRDLGNTEPGDGVRFKGRGLIQITGRSNYRACGVALGLDLIGSPELLEQPENAAMSAAWFWNTRGLNGLADAENFNAITRRINGGLNGQPARIAYWERAKDALA